MVDTRLNGSEAWADEASGVVAPEGGDEAKGVVLAETWRIILDIVENMDGVGTPRWLLQLLLIAL